MHTSAKNGRFAAALMALSSAEDTNGRNEILVAVTEELTEKEDLGKRKHMRSIACESSEATDVGVRDTFHRLIDEEFGLSSNEVSFIYADKPINGFMHGWPVYVGVTVFDEPVELQPKDTNDIRFDGWIPLRVFIQLAFIEGLTRPETAAIIEEGLRLFEERGHELFEGGANA